MIRIYALIAIAALSLSFWAGWAWRGDRAGAEASAGVSQQANAALAQVNESRTTEHKQAETLANIGAKHEEDRVAAQAVPAAVVAGVRAGDLQLRDDLATCHTARLSEAVAGAVQRDEGAQLRAEVAGDIVQVGRDADDQLRACQAIVAADRAEVGR